MLNSINKSQSLADWLCYLESIHPVNIEMGLGRIGRVAADLALTTFDAKVITVAGTNGKGSTCAFLERILLDAGFNVGVTSSPHIQDYRERVRVNGKMLTAQAHADSFAFIESGRSDTTLTYFEFTTLSALKLFQDAALDVVILEVGLGGRLDASNIVSADVAVVTTIDIDHADWLGTDKAVIAREKSGIFRHGKKAICGVINPPVTIAEYAHEIGADLIAVNHDYHYHQAENSWSWQLDTDAKPQASALSFTDLVIPQLPLQNAATAIAAVQALGLAVPEHAIRSGVANARLPGRMQHLGTAPQQYLDVAHNPESARYLATQLNRLKQQAGAPVKVIAVVGMLKDKDIAASLAALTDVVDCWHLAPLQGERAAPCQQIEQGLADAMLLSSKSHDSLRQQPMSHDTIAQAWQSANQSADCNDIIIGFGSFFTVAEITQHISG
ncbi:bifunctional tetrahydrofolate synthase/dihydrofolate synthase [Moritella sp. F3]|uniref:bifunctional tetrahydrofolate synthase/dihydrofolate synthase n=1 Tax=Moritella sp. F3 TaxID=2718882 RepID=UPI0018E139FC|nr:bifunctional tetrahydrofolate synthase/dihydrofolate synthase [Moritella sp. F3]GIC76806.1 bifunctional folylpolyglutamate synthase/dihydrofolate synthase [Moritella sp. F1]GIC80992.1 bifunctional folylpolyglutamate synthase/dihydrofolate synthase [Moritella sp. F3]